MSTHIGKMVSLIAALVLVPAVAADDWPMLGRDRSRNAVSPEKDPPLWWQVPQADRNIPAKNIKWQASLGGRAKGDPIVANGLVWVGTSSYAPKEKVHAAVLKCFREKDGKFLYQYVTEILPGDLSSDLHGRQSRRTRIRRRTGPRDRQRNVGHGHRYGPRPSGYAAPLPASAGY